MDFCIFPPCKETNHIGKQNSHQYFINYVNLVKGNPKSCFYQVEFLLFECLQDVTGGSIVFMLATKCFLIDITTEENRTTRMAVLDAFYSVGYLIGLPLGNYIKKSFGYVPLFGVTLTLTIITMFYVAFFIKDSYALVSEEKKKEFDEEREKNELKCNTGMVSVLSTF